MNNDGTILTLILMRCRFFFMIAVFTFAFGIVQAQIPKLNSHLASRATVLLDFDGQTVRGTGWNWDGTIYAKASGLTSAQITQIFNRVAEDFRIFNLNITTDPAVYSAAPINKRIRIILTPTYQWYGSAGGVAFVNSFTWGDETPAWVFTPLLSNNAKYIAEAASHEIGHTLGLQHQSTWSKSCALITEYAEGRGSGEIGWAPIMGVGYYKNQTTWTIGTTIEGCKTIQNDIYIISKGSNNIGTRIDEYGNSRSTASLITPVNSKFQKTGIITGATDKDFFKISLSRKSRLKALVVPYNVSTGNSGANLDVLLTLIKSTGDTMVRANPKTLLGASFDTLIPAGIYYIGIDGTGNQNVSDYGSVGFYTLSGSIALTTTTTTSSTVMITGDVKNTLHFLNWTTDNIQPTTRGSLEYSLNGVDFMEMAPLPDQTSSYAYQPPTTGNIYYRVKMRMPGDSSYYSNTIMLANGTVIIMGNIVQNVVQLNASGDYEYQLFDETGRTYQRGKIRRGINTVPVNEVKKGLFLMKVFNRQQQLVFKLIKQ